MNKVTTAECIFFLSACEIFRKQDHMLSHKNVSTRLKGFKSCIVCPDHNGIKLEINSINIYVIPKYLYVKKHKYSVSQRRNYKGY